MIAYFNKYTLAWNFICMTLHWDQSLQKRQGEEKKQKQKPQEEPPPKQIWELSTEWNERVTDKA